MTSTDAGASTPSGHTAPPGPGPEHAGPEGAPPDSATRRTFRLLAHLAEGGETLNLSETSRSTGISRLTVTRLLADLEEAGIVHRDKQGGHRLDTPFLRIAAAALSGQDLVRAGRRLLTGLCEELRLTAYLVIPTGADVVYLAREVPATPLVSNVSVGSVVPAHLTTPGRAILATLSAKEICRRLGPEPWSTATALSPTSLAQLEELLEADRAHGAAWSTGGYEEGVTACAVAVPGASGEARAAISVAGPGARFAREPDLAERTARAVQDAAQTLGEILAAL